MDTQTWLIPVLSAIGGGIGSHIISLIKMRGDQKISSKKELVHLDIERENSVIDMYKKLIQDMQVRIDNFSREVQQLSQEHQECMNTNADLRGQIAELRAEVHAFKQKVTSKITDF